MMSEIIIRDIKIEDLDDIMEVEELSFHTPWSRESFIKEITENKLALYIVAEIDGKVVGYCGIWIIVDEGHITNVAVHPEYRGNAIGKKLVKALIAKCKKINIEQLTLEVRVNNDVAIHLYESFGFKGVGVRKGYYTDTKEDALIMWYGQINQ